MVELKKLLDVRSIISLVAAAVFAILSFRGVFDAESIMNVILIVFSFYLGRSAGKTEEIVEANRLEAIQKEEEK